MFRNAPVWSAIVIIVVGRVVWNKRDIVCVMKSAMSRYKMHFSFTQKDMCSHEAGLVFL